VSQILPASRVPRGHVLLHAVGETGLLGGGDGGARVGDCALEAVLVDFLWGEKNGELVCGFGIVGEALARL
jgi:hypothetical protein